MESDANRLTTASGAYCQIGETPTKLNPGSQPWSRLSSIPESEMPFIDDEDNFQEYFEMSDVTGRNVENADNLENADNVLVVDGFSENSELQSEEEVSLSPSENRLWQLNHIDPFDTEPPEPCTAEESSYV